jgi:hypothetical protein
MVGDDALNGTGKKKKIKKKKKPTKADGEEDNGGFPVQSTNENEPLLKSRHQEEEEL